MTRLVSIVILFAAACGSGSGASPDAAPNNDVIPVSCAGATIAATVTTSGFAYSPMTSPIAVDGIVHFTPMVGHDVTDDATPARFHVDFGGDACFQFHTAGTYSFHCSVHGFTGSITVQ